jgi:hypothetical protein
VTDDGYRDELPADLDISGFVGPYTFPNNNRRRIAGAIYLAVAAGTAALVAVRGTGVLVNRGMAVVAVGMAVIGCYHLVAGQTLRTTATDALVSAVRAVGFAVGHASAQLSWRGLISRPTWRILLYSAEDPPLRRGLVFVDGIDGSVVAHFVEDNPEDWTQYKTGKSKTAG